MAPDEPVLPVFLPVCGPSLGRLTLWPALANRMWLRRNCTSSGPSLENAWQLLLCTLEEATHFVRSCTVPGLPFLRILTWPHGEALWLRSHTPENSFSWAPSWQLAPTCRPGEWSHLGSGCTSSSWTMPRWWHVEQVGCPHRALPK